MRRLTTAMGQLMRTFTAFLVLVPTLSAAADWPYWRGPSGQNHAGEAADPPVEWSAKENVRWKAMIPGEGHASPVVVGDRVFVSTVDRDKRIAGLVAAGLEDGKVLWSQVAARGIRLPEMHPNNSHASPTPAVADGRVFVTYHFDDAIHLFAYSVDGKQLWKANCGRFAPVRYQFGYGASPAVWGDLVFVAVESDTPGASKLVAFDQKSGKEKWSTRRTNTITFGSPVAATIGGADQLLIAGGGNIAGYDPATGEELWRADGFATAACGTPVWSGQTVIASGGHPEQVTMAVEAGSGRELWRNNTRCYEQSLVTHDGVVYGVDEAGVLNGWDVETGERLIRKRLGGPESASPVLVTGGQAGPRIYVSNETGETFVFKASREFEPLATNRLGDMSFATLTPLEDGFLHRVGVRDGGKVVQYLYRIGQ